LFHFWFVLKELFGAAPDLIVSGSFLERHSCFNSAQALRGSSFSWSDYAQHALWLVGINYQA
jgi:hypothetical protein